MRHYIARWKRERKSTFENANGPISQKEILKRDDVLKLFFYPLEKVKSISEEQYNRLCSQYPVFEKLLHIHNDFKDLLKSHDAQKLDTWMNDALALEIPELRQFINGLNQDIVAVRNAIAYDYNNGLAEGHINKIKLIKRIMYGRAGFDLLRSKVILLSL